MNYDEKIQHPGEPISSGSEMLKIFGYTDIQNPIYSFDLMNDSNFNRLKECIENKKEIPNRYNANIIRLRDYRLGGMINNFRELCESTLHYYEDAWREYREEYNQTMPEDFYSFWCLYNEITIKKILPKFIDLIDPISMKWIDPEYQKVSIENDRYKYQLNQPIMTADPRFLCPEIGVGYEEYKPEYSPITTICEELNEEVSSHLPEWLTKIETLHNELTNTKPQFNESEKDFIRRIKWEVKRRFTR